MRIRVIALMMLMAAACSPAHAKGKLVGNAGGGEREAVVYSAAKGLEAWTITDPSGEFEFSLDPGEYMVSCGGRLAPYVLVRDGKTTSINHTDQPSIEQPTEMWTPACRSFGQTYIATGTAVSGASFWMPQGSSAMKFTLREDGPDGKIVGESVGTEKCDWITGFGLPSDKLPTIPGKKYYAEIASTQDIAWTIAMPKGPDPYDGGIAYFDRIPHPESDLGLGIGEVHPGPVEIAVARVDQHFIKEGPGSGDCLVAGQSFIGAEGKNILSVSANCGFGGGSADFIYAIKEGGPDGNVIAKKTTRMVSDWGSTAYFEPDEVTLQPGAVYYFEYKRADGKKFYSYLSADTYPGGKAYRDGKEVGDFDQLFEIIGEVEPGGITYPYNVSISDITSSSAKIAWETGTPADGAICYGEDSLVRGSVVANDDLSKEHQATIAGLKPATVYYYRVASWTRKEGSTKTYSRLESFVTPPSGADAPRFDKPEPPPPLQKIGPRNVALVNGSFEQGIDGWKRCSTAKPKESKDYPIGNGPFGAATAGTDGYKPHSGRMLYGWNHLGVDDPNPIVPREDWKQEIISQPIKVQPDRKYLLKAWILTGDRGSGWGRDGRVRMCADTANEGLLDTIDTSAKATATQWFATENEWKQVSLHFTAEKDTAVVGVNFLQWWALEADYLYVDDVSVEESDE